MILSKSVGYWVPHIVEGSFVFPMVFGVDTAAHLIHLLWFGLVTLILWHWARQTWNDSIAWDAIAILLTMPSLLWLASWAYTDYALTFSGIATVYSIWKWHITKSHRWVTVGGIMAGLAMGAKYQSFFIPVVGVLLLTIWDQWNLLWVKRILQFSIIALLVACPWYIRNWVLMGNPLYPFVFGGRFWDSFLTQLQPGVAGTGIGFDLKALLLLPLTVTLGTQDKNFFDGRFGPFFLILLPITVWASWQIFREKDEQRHVLLPIYSLSLVGITAWTLGVINIDNLFQSRYLFPSLIPLTIPLAIGLNSLSKLDSSRLRVSFIMRAMLSFMVFVNLFNFSLQVIVRNPLSVAFGMTSQQEYMEKRQPGYAYALELMKSVPKDANVYFLFEPRSYGIKVLVQPDGLNSNFTHDLWLYKTPEKIMAAWRQQGYTHVLLSKSGADFVFQNNKDSSVTEENALKQVENLLERMNVSQDGEYVLYRIP